MSLEAGLDIPAEVGTEAIVENNTEEIVQAAIDTAAAEPEATGAGSAEVALTTFPKLAHTFLILISLRKATFIMLKKIQIKFMKQQMFFTIY